MITSYWSLYFSKIYLKQNEIVEYFNNYIGSLWIVDTSIYILTLVHVAPPTVTSSLLLLSSVLVPFDENILPFFFLVLDWHYL